MLFLSLLRIVISILSFRLQNRAPLYYVASLFCVLFSILVLAPNANCNEVLQKLEKAANSNALENNKASSKKTWIRASSKRSDFLLFLHPGQRLEGKFGSALNASALARSGTVITMDGNQPLLHDGCLNIACRKGTAIIAARLATVTVPEGANVLLECIPSQGTLKMAVLSGSNVTVRQKNTASLSLHGGEELLLSDKKSSEGTQTFKMQDLVEANADLLGKDVSANTGHPLRMLGDEATTFRISAPDTISLLSGELFFLAPYPIRVHTIVADALVLKGALADIDADEKETRIKAFNEPVQAFLPAGEESMEVKQGQELLLSSHELSQQDLDPPDGIGRRRNEKIKFNNVLHAASSDFSILSFLDQAKHVSMIKHPRTTSDKELQEKVLKTAAAVQTVVSRYGPYHSQPRISRRHVDAIRKTRTGV